MKSRMLHGKDLLTKSCWYEDCPSATKPEPSFTLQKGCSVIHRGEVFFYGAKEVLFYNDKTNFTRSKFWVEEELRLDPKYLNISKSWTQKKIRLNATWTLRNSSNTLGVIDRRLEPTEVEDLREETTKYCQKILSEPSVNLKLNKIKCEIKSRKGVSDPNKIIKFDCSNSYKLMEIDLQFDFVDGVCGSNGFNIILCFPNGNSRLCYKSNTPAPKQWWEWFSYVPIPFNSHDKDFLFYF